MNQEIENNVNVDEENRYLVFSIKNQDYALEIGFVTEIIEVQRITMVPYLPDCLKGIINLRGLIVPVMDVRLRFGFEEADYTDRTCIIVIENKGVKLGLIVDRVVEVASIDQSNPIGARPDLVGRHRGYIKGVGCDSDVLRLLLDCDKLMEI